VVRVPASLFDAYRQYKWPFSVVMPGDTGRTGGTTFPDTVGVLERLSARLRQSIPTQGASDFLAAAKAVLCWGGVRGGLGRLQALGDDALPKLTAAAEQLDPLSSNTGRLDAVEHMNAGFSKIYSLLLDDFPIYDSRVACALASFVACYCRENNLAGVPTPLEFRIPPSRSLQRDPSEGTIRFRSLWWGQARGYAVVNLKAAWLLRLLALQGPFGALPSSERVLGLQAALFILGYAKLSLAPPA
jgi:hypothetical protein